jgi:hypothetical protein
VFIPTAPRGWCWAGAGLVASLLMTTAPATAQVAPGRLSVGETDGTVARGASVDAVLSATPPTLDGRLDDAIWTTAARLTDFFQRNPVEGAPATEATDVYVAYDSTNLYVAVHAHYADVGLVRANRSDRDQLSSDDTLNVYLDPFRDEQRAYVFMVNGYGVQGDAIIGSSGGNNNFQGGGGNFGGGQGLPNGDSSWDALFASAGQLVEDGWTAELAIPFKSLRYPARGDGESHAWGFQIARSIQSKSESVVWSPTTRDISGFMTQMGTLGGLRDLSTSRNLELLPTVTAVQFGSLDEAGGGFREDDFRPEAGVNLKYGVTSQLTADLTFNPDFSQIESDQPQIEVNQRFPLFFNELRPFFLEGQEIFSTQGEVTLVHTRSIIDPRYGGKLSGKIGRATLGVLVADDEAPGKLDDPADPLDGQTARFLVGRLRYDIYAGSYIGALVTDREFADDHSRVGALDGRFKLGQQKDLDVRLAFSSTRDVFGDRSGLSYDLRFRHRGRNLEYNLQHYSVEPGFHTATGFVQRTDTRRTAASVQYRWWPEHWLTNWGPRFNYARNYDFDGVLQDEDASARVQLQFSRNIMINVEGSRDMERFLGIPFHKWRRQIFTNVSTSRRVSVGGGLFWGDQVSFTDEPFLGDSVSGRLFLTVQPFARLQSSLNVNFSQLVDPRTDTEVFDVKIYRSQTSYQFTERLLLRSILEYNTFDRTFDNNLLLAYRVNSGTVFYLGYDDHYQQGDRILNGLCPGSQFERTNRAFFTKFSYLFRY